jgi:phage terminase large subunit
MMTVEIPYRPRPLQREIGRLLRAHRFGVLVCHRRFGKTVLGVNVNQQTATMCPQPRPRCAYIGPTYTQGKTNAWDYMQFFARPIPGVRFNQSELRVDYPNKGQAASLARTTRIACAATTSTKPCSMNTACTQRRRSAK